MFGFLKKGSEFIILAKIFGELFISVNKLESLFDKSEDDINKLRNHYKLEILGLAFIANKEIVNRMDKYGWQLEHQILVKEINSSRITIMYAWSNTITKIIMLVGLFKLQEEYEDIISNGPLSNIIENYVENEKNITRMFR